MLSVIVDPFQHADQSRLPSPQLRVQIDTKRYAMPHEDFILVEYNHAPQYLIVLSFVSHRLLSH